MGAKLLDSPFTLILILLVVLLLFGAPKLPGMARSLGQSMRIFKSEVKEMKRDSADSKEPNVTVDGKPMGNDQTVNPPAGSTPATDASVQHSARHVQDHADPNQRPGV